MCVSKLVGCPDISHLVVGATRYAIPRHNLIKILALLCEFLHSTTTYKSVLEPKSVLSGPYNIRPHCIANIPNEASILSREENFALQPYCLQRAGPVCWKHRKEMLEHRNVSQGFHSCRVVPS